MEVLNGVTAVLKILSRCSPLAQAQVREVMAGFPAVAWENILMTSFGDRHREISLLGEIRPDFFTDEIDCALLSGAGDVAVHSAKDLPWPMPEGLEVIALTNAVDATDSLVSRGNLTLAALPAGAKIGTSSVVRKNFLLSMRPTIEIVGIRGNIEERIALADSGTVDAVVVATCALQRLNLTHRIAEALPFATHPLQGKLAIVSHTGRPELKVLFHAIDSRSAYGKVWLVGAGPGDPELLTVKADRILSMADVIYYDDLTSDAILDRYRGERKYVGKRKGHHAYEQDAIGERLYQSALLGNNVVRLKGGDPLIFSRGGEELEYLQSRLVPVEVVAGLSAVQACAASAGIPLTHRGVSRTLCIASGHYAETNDIPVLTADTLVYYMAATKLKELGTRLQTAGRDTHTPVAIIRNGGLQDEECFLTTIGKLGEEMIASPATVIVGNVVRQYQRPEKVLYTGIDPANFRHAGYIVHYPLIETNPVDFVINNEQNYDTVLFSSKNAVRYFLEKYSLLGKRIVTIGKATEQTLRQHGYKTDFIAAQPSSDSLMMLIRENPQWRILYPCSNLSNNPLHSMPNVAPVIVYETRTRAQGVLGLNEYSAVVFTSPSTVDAFIKLYSGVPQHLLCIAIGPITKNRLKEKGIVAERIIERDPFVRYKETIDGQEVLC